MSKVHLAFMAFLAVFTIAAVPQDHTLDQLCMNIAYAHHHKALCANATMPWDYN
jgi:hypothetical protein